MDYHIFITYVTIILFSQLRTLRCQVTRFAITDVRLLDINGALAIANSGSIEGKLQVQRDNNPVWGDVCDDNVGLEEARVACVQLGYQRAPSELILNTNNNIFSTDGNFLLEDLSCVGTEATLTDCQYALNSSRCDVSLGDYAIAIRCFSANNGGPSSPTPIATTQYPGECTNANNLDVQLVSRLNSPGIGYVQIRTNAGSQWQYVCDDNWGVNAAKVVCQQLCYDPAVFTAKAGVPYQYRLEIDNNTPRREIRVCDGTETRLSDCQTLNNVFCSAENSNEFAGVQCVPDPAPSFEKPDFELTCDKNTFEMRIDTSNNPDLEPKDLNMVNDCNELEKTEEGSNPRFIVLKWNINECGTTMRTNSTHVIYTNTVIQQYTTQDGIITRDQTYRIELQCIYGAFYSVTDRVVPQTETITQKAKGNFEVSMRIYESDNFVTIAQGNPVKIQVGEFLNLGINLADYDDKLKLVVTDCTASANGVINSPVLSRPILVDKCPVEREGVSTFPVSPLMFGVQLNTIRFIGFQYLYLHCSTFVCMRYNNFRECDRSCNSTKQSDPTEIGRRKRSAEFVDREEVDIKVTLVYSVNNNNEGNNNNDNSNNNQNNDKDTNKNNDKDLDSNNEKISTPKTRVNGAEYTPPTSADRLYTSSTLSPEFIEKEIVLTSTQSFSRGFATVPNISLMCQIFILFNTLFLAFEISLYPFVFMN